MSLSAPGAYYGLVQHPNGAVVPVDEPAVAAARADHLAVQAAQYGALHAVPAVPAVHHPAGYSGPIHIPTLVSHPNGAIVPADEPAVAAARADHLAAHGYAYAAAAAPIGYASGAFVAHPNGAVVPVDEPAVAAARAEHLAAHGVYGPNAVAGPAAYAYGGLVAHPNGAVVPVDEPAVAAARAEHFAAKE